jgi:hypothetical protein
MRSKRVAEITGVGKPRRVVIRMIDMLSSDNVFDMKRNERRGFLWETAVFAPVLGSLPHQAPGRHVHITRVALTESGELSIG